MARVSFVERLKQLGLAILSIVLFLVIGIALSGGLLLALGPKVQSARLDAGETWRTTLQQVAIVGSFLAATWVVGVLVHKRPWRDWGWRPAPGTARSFARGALVGAVMATGAVALALVGGAKLRIEESLGTYVLAAIPLGLTLFGAALAEELTFRGLPIRRQADALGPTNATVVLALAFGLAHLKNPSATLLGAVNIMLAGAWLSIAFFTSGMGLAWGLHFGWNAMLALGFDAPVSGFMMHVPGPEYTVGRYSWFDGGVFGPEGGLVATIALIGGAAYLLRDRWRRRPVVEAAA